MSPQPFRTRVHPGHPLPTSPPPPTPMSPMTLHTHYPPHLLPTPAPPTAHPLPTLHRPHPHSLAPTSTPHPHSHSAPTGRSHFPSPQPHTQPVPGLSWGASHSRGPPRPPGQPSALRAPRTAPTPTVCWPLGLFSQLFPQVSSSNHKTDMFSFLQETSPSRNPRASPCSSLHTSH